MDVLFWTMGGLCLYAYAGYPLLLWLLTRRRRQPWENSEEPSRWPYLSVMLPAHNEENVLARRVENLLSLDYPADRLQIVVGLDGCSDGSAAAVREFYGRGVEVLEENSRQGKTALLNKMIAMSTGQIIVFTDANCLYDSGALKHLLRPFQQSRIGCVIGELKFENQDDPTVGGGEGIYWRLENGIKEMESRLGGTLVANGSIYAIRKELLEDLPGWISDDSVNPLRVLAAGKQVVFQRQAVAREKAALLLREEFQRKARMVTRQLGSHMHVRGFLWPLRPSLAFRLVSHKLLRWLVPIFLALAVMANLVLLPEPVYILTGVLLGLFCLAGIAGGIILARNGRPPRLFRLVVYFWVVNGAALKGLYDFVRGRQRAVWRISASTR